MDVSQSELVALTEGANRSATALGKVRHVETVPFGPALVVERFELGNGLKLLLSVDRSAKIISCHTWLGVGSRHEQVGKTGLAHLFEHLMFNEMQGVPAGEFDKRLEEAGAENNASTWLDFTQYTINLPSDQLELALGLEANRLANLILREPQVSSEKEVVANERRYRVDDDVDGSVNEELFKLAFVKHPYSWPTIGWMEDIQGFTTKDCSEFYRTYYAPNNATLVLVGDLDIGQTLSLVSRLYGTMPPSVIPEERGEREPEQTAERRKELVKATATEKLAMGYRCPAMADADHTTLSVLLEVLFGGRASRVHRRLVQELELASDLGAFVGPFRDPGLAEISAAARDQHTAEELLAVIDEEIARVQTDHITAEELERAASRTELSLLASLENADGKASTLGFYETVLGHPAAAFERLGAIRRLTPRDMLLVAERYLKPSSRSVIFVRPDPEAGALES